ncbi:MAG: hypothetical protein HGA19_03015 [Oscillochloris sp.]|nr:hypothetical protein [Oscillochloris sp.]
MSTHVGDPDQPPAMRLSLLGKVELIVAGSPICFGWGSKSEALLIHLALARQQRLQRADLLERLWPDQPTTSANSSLTSLIYRLNKLVGAATKQFALILNVHGYYHLNCAGDAASVDVLRFEALASQGRLLRAQGDPAGTVACYEQALALYCGDLGGDMDIRTVIERERLRATHLGLLAELADYHAPAAPEQALIYLQRLLKYDPCREDAHRLAMRCYVRLNARTVALRQFQLCCQALKAEFNVEPEAETVALFNQIRLNQAAM